MRIIQLLPAISFGDAVSNDALAIRDILISLGYSTDIYAEHIDTRLPRNTAKVADTLSKQTSNDLIIYHASTGTKLNFGLSSIPGKKILIYHNITPAHFFRGYSDAAEQLTQYGYEGIRFLADKIQYCITDSEYNKQELMSMGYACPIDVCPILIPFTDYDQAPDQRILRRFNNDGIINWLFVGRIAPNKKQEDIIRAFYVYQRDYNPKSRLFLVGNNDGMENYDQQLKEYVVRLGIQDKVIFLGHIKFNAILAYYHLADVFVCMSEHEGFCVPIVEAMYFGKPIVAYSSSAIPETMAKGGLLLEDKDPYMAAAVIDRVIRDKDLQEYISIQQKERLKDFSYESAKERFLECLKKGL